MNFRKIYNNILEIICNICIYSISILKKYNDKRIELDTNELYVVYINPSAINKDIYIFNNGKDALELVELYNNLNSFLGRRFIKVLYGKCSTVFKYKMVSLMDLVFTWNATEEERRKVCSYIADVPNKIN